jgi:AraC-like DNA-binding protein
MKPIRSFDLTTTLTFILNNFSHRKIDIVREEILIPDIATVAVKKAISYINNNYTKNITLDQLAELTNRDRCHLIRCFKEKLKITPHQYILKLRIDEAMRLIENTDETLLSISKKIGFGSHSNFCDVFKKHTGHTPINYKYIKSIRKG